MNSEVISSMDNPYESPRHDSDQSESRIRWSAKAIVCFLPAFLVTCFLVVVVLETLRPEFPAHVKQSRAFQICYSVIGLLIAAGIAWICAWQKYRVK